MNYKTYVIGIAAMLSLTGCIDNNYDLGDIDTTSQFKVNDLTLPLNLDPIVLDQIITVKEGDQIKVLDVNGQKFYGVEEQGDFSSDPINVGTFEADHQDLTSKEAVFRLLDGPMSAKRRAGEFTRTYHLDNNIVEEIDYTAEGINSSIRGIDAISFENVHFTINLTIEGDNLNTFETTLNDLRFTIPKGLNIKGVTGQGYTYKPSDYDISTGLLSVGTLQFTNGKTTLTINADGLDFNYYPGVFTINQDTDEGVLNLVTEFTILEGTNLTFSDSADNLSSLPLEVKIIADYEITPLIPTAMMGTVYYNLDSDGLQIDPIDLSNIPDFLDSDETNLILSNPQLFLNVNNPVGQFGLSYQSGLNIIALRDEVETDYPLDREIVVPAAAGSYSYLLAPNTDAVTNVPEGYTENLNRITYSSLGKILSGAGLPSSIDVKLVDPQIPTKKTTSPILLGQDIEPMEGSYRFIVPLSLAKGSQIVKTIDGWGSEDLEKLIINKLNISAVASSTLPTGVILTLYPIDKDGNALAPESTATLPAMATNHDLNLNIEGTIRNLDGIEIYVIASDTDGDKPLAPDQTITLNDIRVTVSGNYTTDF